MRRLAVLMTLVAATQLFVDPLTAEAAKTCFGKDATIADHSGLINGTAGNDVIIGDAGDNEIDANGGVD